VSEKEVRVRLKIEADASEVAKAAASTQTALSKPIDEARKKAVMAANEDRKLYYETIKRLDAEDQGEKRRAQTIEETERRRVQAATIADRELFYKTTERLKKEEEAKAKAIASERMQARQSLGIAGLSMAGAGGAVGGYGQGVAIGGALESLGYGNLGRAAPMIGLAAGAGTQVLDSMVQYRLATQNPFMTREQREREYALAIPGGQKALQLADIAMGTGYELDRERGKHQGRFNAEIFSAGAQAESRIQSVALDRFAPMRVAEAEERAVQQFQRPSLRLGDRGTFAGQRNNTESEQRLAVANRVVEAERRVAVASADYRANVERVNKLKEVGVRLSKEGAILESQSTGGSEGSQIENRMKLATNQQLRLQNLQDIDQAGVRLQEARERTGQAGAGLRTARIGERQAEIQILEQREQSAAASGSRFAGLGVDGRARGMAALEALQRIGIENAPSSLIAEAQSVAPRGVQDLLDKAGQNLPELERLGQLSPADAESRNLAGIRGRINELKESIPADQQGLDENLAGIAADAKKAMFDLLKFMADEIPLVVKKVENAIRLSAIQ
jgi:hypothetical protein